MCRAHFAPKRKARKDPKQLLRLVYVSRVFESVQGIGLESVAVLPNMPANKRGPQLKPCQASALRAPVKPSQMLSATAFP
jgi:hypothetical protein